MWMIFLYGMATFMETGIGIWMFGKMFPERKTENRIYIRILYILLFMTTYTLSNAYVKINTLYKVLFFMLFAIVVLNDIVLYQKKGKYNEKYIRTEKKFDIYMYGYSYYLAVLDFLFVTLLYMDSKSISCFFSLRIF